MDKLKKPANANINTRSTTSVDKHVGKRLRLARKLRGLTQSKLGDLVGIQFQQIQKYESGSNRVPASRLHKLAKVLILPITYFFPESDINDEVGSLFVDLKNLDPQDAKIVLEGLENSDDESRRYIVRLVKMMASKP